jgi:glutamate synthase (NADPH/NADH) small chain
VKEVEKEYQPTISREEIKANFKDIAPEFTSTEAFVESSRCLYCYDAPCIKACPTGIDIPRFINQIASGDVLGSARTIFMENIVGGSCGRVCPTEVLCEGACVYNAINKKPIEIGRLQRFATDRAISDDIHFFTPQKSSGKKVAIIGAGPAGLSCAHELTRLGHACVVYEASAQAGGLNTTGVAGYKVNTAFSLREANYISKIGFEIKYSSPVGEKLTVNDLMKSYDAVFMAVGLGDTAELGIEGEDLAGCLEAMEFIRPTREADLKGCRIGRNVLVIGGGNTAIDVATAAVRLGCDSTTIVYRRNAELMPAFHYEFELAKKEGVQFRWLTAPQRVVGKDGKVIGLECINLRLVDAKSGKGKLEAVAGSEHVIPCDMVVKALGQTPTKTAFHGLQALEMKDGLVVVQKESGATSLKGLFAGGDCINGGGEVVDAVQHGKIGARGIHQYLGCAKH